MTNTVIDHMRLAEPEDIANAPANPYVDRAATAEKEAVESRSQKINSDILQQKRELQGTIFNVVFFVIIALYMLFLMCALVLALSLLPFQDHFPVTGLIFLGILAAVPTLLSAFLMTGLFSHKDSGKEDRVSASELSIVAKFISELVKLAK